MSVHEIAQQLDAAASRMLPDAELVEALSALAEAIVALHPIADTSSDDELRAALGAWRNADAEIRRVWSVCDQAVTLVEEYMTNNIGVPPGARPVASAPPPAEHAPSSTSEPAPEPPPTVQGVDGSEYPADAASDVVNLPPRVGLGLDRRTIGQATVNGRPVGEIRSGPDSWSPRVSDRLKTLGIEYAGDLFVHAEMKLAALMLDLRAREGTITINNAPCGSQPGQTPGCDQVLPAFLREGYTLTVRGTTRDGKPFSRTYRGEAT